MAYSPVPTVATGDLWSAANHNQYIRDNFAAGCPDIITAKGDIMVGSAANAASPLSVGVDNGMIIMVDSAQSLGVKYTYHYSTFGFLLGDGASTLTTGWKMWSPEIPFNCVILSARLFANAIGSAVIDIWKKAYADFPPTDSDSITAAAPPTLSSAQKSEDTTLSGWTTTLTKGDILGFYVDSASTIKSLTVSLGVRRTG